MPSRINGILSTATENTPFPAQRGITWRINIKLELGSIITELIWSYTGIRPQFKMQFTLQKMPQELCMESHGSTGSLGAGEDRVWFYGRAVRKLCYCISAVLDWALEGMGWLWCRCARLRQGLLPWTWPFPPSLAVALATTLVLPPRLHNL